MRTWVSTGVELLDGQQRVRTRLPYDSAQGFCQGDGFDVGGAAAAESDTSLEACWLRTAVRSGLSGGDHSSGVDASKVAMTADHIGDFVAVSGASGEVKRAKRSGHIFLLDYPQSNQYVHAMQNSADVLVAPTRVIVTPGRDNALPLANHIVVSWYPSRTAATVDKYVVQLQQKINGTFTKVEDLEVVQIVPTFSRRISDKPNDRPVPGVTRVPLVRPGLDAAPVYRAVVTAVSQSKTAASNPSNEVTLPLAQPTGDLPIPVLGLPFLADPFSMVDIDAVRFAGGVAAMASKWRYQYLKDRALYLAEQAMGYEQQILSLQSLDLSKVAAAELVVQPVLQDVQDKVAQLGSQITVVPTPNLGPAVSELSQAIAHLSLLTRIVDWMSNTSMIRLWYDLFGVVIKDIAKADTSLARTKAFLTQAFPTDLEEGVQALFNSVAADATAEVDRLAGPLRGSVAAIINSVMEATEELYKGFDEPLLQGYATGRLDVPNPAPFEEGLARLEKAVEDRITEIRDGVRAQILADGATPVQDLFVVVMVTYVVLPILAALLIALAGGPFAAAALAAAVLVAGQEIVHLVMRWLSGPIAHELDKLRGRVDEAVSGIRSIIAQSFPDIPDVEFAEDQLGRQLHLAGIALRQLSDLVPKTYLDGVADLLGAVRDETVARATTLAHAAELALGQENAAAFDAIRLDYRNRLPSAPLLPGGVGASRHAAELLMRDIGRLENDRLALDSGREFLLTQRLSLFSLLGGQGNPLSEVAASGEFLRLLRGEEVGISLTEAQLLDRSHPGVYRALISDVRVSAVFAGDVGPSVSLPVQVTHLGRSRTRIRRTGAVAAPSIPLVRTTQERDTSTGNLLLSSIGPMCPAAYRAALDEREVARMLESSLGRPYNRLKERFAELDPPHSPLSFYVYLLRDGLRKVGEDSAKHCSVFLQNRLDAVLENAGLPTPEDLPPRLVAPDEEMIAALQSAIDSLQNEIAALTSRIGILESEVATLNELIDRLQEEIATLGSDIARLTAEIETLSAQIRTLTAEIGTLTVEIATLESDISTLTAEIATLNADIATLNADIARLTAEIGTLSAEIATLNAEIATLNAEIATLETETGSLEEEILFLEAELERTREMPLEPLPGEDHQDAVRRRQVEIAALENQIAAKQAQLATKQAELDGKRGELAGKQAQLAGKQAELDGKQAELDGKQAELATKQAQLATKQAELDGKQAELDGKQAELDGKRAQLTSAEGQLTSAQAQLTGNQTELATTQAQLATTQAQLTSDQTLLTSTQAQLDSLLAQRDSKQAERDGLLAELTELVSDLQGALSQWLDEAASRAEEASAALVKPWGDIPTDEDIDRSDGLASKMRDVLLPFVDPLTLAKACRRFSVAQPAGKWGTSFLEEDESPDVNALGYAKLVRDLPPETVSYRLGTAPRPSPAVSFLSSLTPVPPLGIDSSQYRPFENRGLEGVFTLRLPTAQAGGIPGLPAGASVRLADLVLEVTYRACHDPALEANLRAARRRDNLLDSTADAAGGDGGIQFLGTRPFADVEAGRRTTLQISLRAQRDRVLQTWRAARAERAARGVGIPQTPPGSTQWEGITDAVFKALAPLGKDEPLKPLDPMATSFEIVFGDSPGVNTPLLDLSRRQVVTPPMLGLDLDPKDLAMFDASSEVGVLSIGIAVVPTAQGVDSGAAPNLVVGNRLARLISPGPLTAGLRVTPVDPEEWQGGNQPAVGLQALFADSGNPMTTGDRTLRVEFGTALAEQHIYDVIVSISTSLPTMSAIPTETALV